jgi:cytochrome c
MKYAVTVPALLASAALLGAAAPAATGAMPDAAGPDGPTLFRQRCQGCHSVTPGQTTPLAPNLAGVVGRKAAATSFAYSPALKASDLVWSRETIDRYLAGPSRLVPGTRMAIFVPDPRQRATIIDYLARTGH